MGVGLDTLNPDDTIKVDTKLYGLIAVEAMKNNLFAKVNKLLKTNSIDAMMIPMNIREDDFYYTIANMKKSKVNGAYISKEFQEEILELLDEKDEIIEVYNKCDFVFVKDGKLKGYILETNDLKSNEELAEKIYNLIKG